ncbi:MAG: patatin-like phospholipase family protein [Gallionella sp.]
MMKNISDPSQTEQAQQRLGLALSGGGFRASFYHLGVLSRMAELGLLHHVEVISTVSGGSIIGALYYLRLRELLMSKEDAQITGQDYVDLAARIERDFLSAVQQNLRTRTFVNPWQNMKMALPHYSRSNRIGELYDRYFYRTVFGAGRDKPIEMRELKIQPRNDPHHDGFNPTIPGHNDARFAKVPVLMINATTINTGHNWRFLASRMGEQPHATAFADDIDKNSRLQRGEYDKIVGAQQDFPLGIAVAASAGVPLLFPPLPISGMYQDWRVQLVDGGIYDNQGIAALEDPLYPCTEFIISDASGQMGDVQHPDTSAISVLSRVMDIFTARVREEMVKGLESTWGKENVAFFHLTRGLESYDIPYTSAAGTQSQPKLRSAPGTLSSYGVDPGVQQMLSRVRTDLDSFTDTEAFALMTDGYLMSEADLRRIAGHFETRPVDPVQWRFLSVRERMADPALDERFVKQLQVAGKRFFKPFLLGVTPKLVGFSLAFIAVMALYGALLWKISDLLFPGWLAAQWASLKECLLDIQQATLIVSGAVAMLLGEWLGRTIQLFKWLRYPMRIFSGLFTRFILPLLGAFPVYVYLQTIDRYYVEQGRLT